MKKKLLVILAVIATAMGTTLFSSCTAPDSDRSHHSGGHRHHTAY